jgi:hypothetical protein
MSKVQEAVSRLNAAAGRTACEIRTDVVDTSPIFGDARLVVGGNYVCIEAMASGAQAIGAGYDGVFGLVSMGNLKDGAEQYFGDHMTPITGVERDDRLFVNQLVDAIPKGLEAGMGSTDLEGHARSMFRREEGIEIIEREFANLRRTDSG